MSKLYEGRHCAHRYMADPKSFPCCDGRGWTYKAREGTEDDYIPDMLEVYCDCEAGQKRREVEDSSSAVREQKPETD